MAQFTIEVFMSRHLFGIWHLIDDDFEVEYQVYNSAYNFLPYTFDFMAEEYFKRNLNVEANLARFLLHNSSPYNTNWAIKNQLYSLKIYSIRFKIH
jgi:hypothetical protein